MSKKKACIILAAGKGKRMKSDLPKVLHEINGQPIIRILLDTIDEVGFDKTVVVIGFKGELVQEALADYEVEFAWQREQKGTGHAVIMTKEHLEDFEGTTLVALGDVPFLSKRSIDRLFKVHEKNAAAATCLSAILDDAGGYGRIVRKGKTDILQDIVEDKDASPEIARIKEINSGTFCFDNKQLFEALGEITDDNAQGELYLTDTIKIMHDKGLRVSVVAADNPDEVRGINSIEQLNLLARKFV